MRVNSPYKVFARREGMPLENATCFELVLELRGKGWRARDLINGVSKKDIPDFCEGALTQNSRSKVARFVGHFAVLSLK